MSEKVNHHISLKAEPPHRSKTEIVSLVIGIFLFFAGLISLPFPNVLGLNLTIGHCLIITIAGGILAWNGRNYKSKNCFYACLFFGLFFLSHGIAGSLVDLVAGPSATNPFGDGSLGGMLPDYFILERNDHILNFIIGLTLLGAAYAWWGHYRKAKFIKVTPRL